MSKPSTTLEFLDALKAKHGFSSDYQLWKFLGWKQTTVSRYRVGKSTLSRSHAMRIADELRLSREYVVACVELEREPEEHVRGVWENIAHRFRDAAAVILLATAAATGAPQITDASVKFASFAGDPQFTPVTIMRTRVRRRAARPASWLQWLLTWFPALNPADPLSAA